MIQICQSELLKVIKNRLFLLLLVFFAGINILLISTVPASDYYDKDAYRQLYQDIQVMSPQQQTAYIEERLNQLQTGADEGGAADELFYTTDQYSEYMLFRDLYQELEQVNGYQQYLEGIIEYAENTGEISIFNNQGEFSRRNARKTAAAFEPLRDIPVSYTNSKALNTAMDFYVTDILLMILLFLTASILIVEEKEQQHFRLLRSAKNGRTTLIGAKIVALVILCTGLVLLFYTSSFIAAFWQYGIPSLQVPIQSVYGFDSCVLRLSVMQYLFVYYLSKLAVAVLTGLIFYTVALTAKSAVMVYIRVVGIFVIALGCNLLIPGSSAFQILKYANLIYFIRTTPVYQYYFNLNLFQYPVSMTMVFVTVTAAGIAGLLGYNIRYFARRDIAVAASAHLWERRGQRLKVSVRLIYHEAFKICVVGRAGLVILLLLLFQGYSYQNQSRYVDTEEAYYRHYMEVLRGTDAEETATYIETQQQHYEALEAQQKELETAYDAGEIKDLEYTGIQNQLQEQLAGRSGFERVREQYAYVQAHNQETSTDPARMVYKTGWETLTADSGATGYKEDLMLAIMAVLAVAAISTPVFGNEYTSGAIALITSCRRGRMELMKQKVRIGTALTSAVFVISYIVQLISIAGKYGLMQADAYISSIPTLAAFPLPLRLWQYLLLVYAVRYIAIISVMYLTYTVSLYMHQIMPTILVITAVVILPLIIGYLGIDMIGYCSLNSFLSGNQYLDMVQSQRFAAFAIVIPLAIIVGCRMKLKRSFRE